MVPARHVHGARLAAILALGLLVQLSSFAVCADAAPAGANNDHLHLQPVTAQQIAADDSTAAPSSLKPLWLPRTRADWDSIAEAVHVSARQSSKAIRSPLEEITVTAPAELLPMADVYDEMWGGILAPVWAVLHPTQAWRIFLPIPPE